MNTWFWLCPLAKQRLWKRLRKCLFDSIRLSHYFDWQVLSLNESAFLFFARDWVLPGSAKKISFLTILIITSIKNNCPKKVQFLFKIQELNVSIINVGCTKGTSSSTVINVICAKFYLANFAFNLSDRKLRFPESSQSSTTGKLIFGQFDVIFSQRMNFFRCRGDFFYIKNEQGFFKHRMSSLAVLNKKLIIFLQNYRFWFFWLTRSTFKVDFLDL